MVWVPAFNENNLNAFLPRLNRHNLLSCRLRGPILNFTPIRRAPPRWLIEQPQRDVSRPDRIGANRSRLGPPLLDFHLRCAFALKLDQRRVSICLVWVHASGDVLVRALIAGSVMLMIE